MKYIKISIAFIIGAFITSILSSCEPDLKNEILKYIRQDHHIDYDECFSLKEFIIKNQRKHEELFINNKLNEELFKKYILDFIKTNLKRYDDVTIACDKLVKVDVNIYIENSGSMDGYINGNTVYKSNLSDLIVQTRGVYGIENTNTFFVNSNFYESDSEDIRSFIKRVDAGNAEYKQGNTSTSELNETLKLILSKSDDRNISILLSDFIYSLDKNQNTSDGLGLGKSLTKDAFLQHLNKHEMSTYLLKFNSDFNGRYYSYDNVITNMDGKRPYYLLATGKDELLRDFVKKIQLSKLKGFENSYYISNSADFKPYYEVFDSKNNIGKYKKSRSSTNDNLILDNILLDNGLFRFVVAVDFSEVPDQSILTEISNYQIEGDFIISSIHKRHDMFINENFSSGVSNKVKQTKATHFIVLESNSSNFDKSLAVQLTNKKPAWILRSNSENDKAIKTEGLTTFGFNYFVDGIYEAYNLKNNNKNNEFLSLNFTLNK